MAEIYKKGQRLYIKTIDLQMEGIFVTTDEKKTKMTLKNCKLLPSNETVEGLRHFFSKDIIEIRALEPSRPVTGPHKEKDWNVIRKLNNELFLSTSGKKNLNGSRKISSHDYEEFSYLAKEYIYLDSLDERFINIIALIKNTSTIAVAFQGEERGRFYKINLISVSLPKNTYLFDLINGNNINNNNVLITYFKDIFESESIEKIVYDSRFVTDCLIKNYQVNLRNIFDCQVYDIMIKRQHQLNIYNFIEFAPSLNSTLKYHFLLPNALRPYLFIRDGYIEEDAIRAWEMRPLSHERQLHVVKKSCYLFLLKDALKKQVLHNVFAISKAYIEMEGNIYNNEVELETPEIITKLIQMKCYKNV